MTAKTYVLTFTKESGEGVQRVSASKVEAVDGGFAFYDSQGGLVGYFDADVLDDGRENN